MSTSMSELDQLSISIAKACGVPADSIVGLTYQHRLHEVPHLFVEYLVVREADASTVKLGFEPFVLKSVDK